MENAKRYVYRLNAIANKAEYISDIARGIAIGESREDVPLTLLDEIFSKLLNIADTLDEYHDFGEEDD